MYVSELSVCLLLFANLMFLKLDYNVFALKASLLGQIFLSLISVGQLLDYKKSVFVPERGTQC